MSYGPHMLVPGVIAALLGGAYPATSAEVQPLEREHARRPARSRDIVAGVSSAYLLPPSKKRPRVSTCKPLKRGKTAAALRRHGVSRA